MKNSEEGKILVHVTRLIVSLIVYLLILPSLVVLIAYYFKLVLLGDMYFKEFLDSFKDYSYRPVIDFYISVRYEVESFINRLKT